MMRSILIILLFTGCVRKAAPHDSAYTDSVLTTDAEPTVQYDRFREDLVSSDSVLLLSHHSPNMPIRNPKTGGYYPHSILFIEKGKINYAMSVQERKQLNQHEIKELADILSLPAVDDSVRTVCFQPRNAVVAFKESRMSCFDFCFDCYGFSSFGSFDSELIMNAEKYTKLMDFYKKLGFKYELD